MAGVISAYNKLNSREVMSGVARNKHEEVTLSPETLSLPLPHNKYVSMDTVGSDDAAIIANMTFDLLCMCTNPVYTMDYSIDNKATIYDYSDDVIVNPLWNT